MCTSRHAKAASALAVYLASIDNIIKLIIEQVFTASKEYEGSNGATALALLAPRSRVSRRFLKSQTHGNRSRGKLGTRHNGLQPQCKDSEDGDEPYYLVIPSSDSNSTSVG